MTYGWTGKMLRVNLTNARISEEAVGGDFLRKYVGPRGIGARLLLDEVEAGCDALGEANKLLFVTGPLTGHPVPGAARVHVISKSPLTGIYGESNAGGAFGVQLKMAGYDYLVIEGRAPRQSYLWISDRGVEVRDARHLWGKLTGETEDLVRQETAGRAAVACIGPAGEKGALISSIVCERRRVAGRTGMGAVMAAKNLKAVAAHGDARPPMADPEGVAAMARTIRDRLKNSPGKQALAKYGTALGVSVLNTLGILPTRNFATGVFGGHDKINGEAMANTILERRFTCPGCPIACIRGVKVESGPFAPVDPAYGGPEYETLAALGSMCLVDDLAAIARAHQLCNSHGMDTMSAGVIVAWVMECFEKGTLAERDLNGIRATWGSAEAMVGLVGMMCRREGIGEVLSLGVARASRAIGKGSSDFAMQVKGLEVALQEPRGKKGQGFGYAIGARGASHTEVVPDPVFENPNAFPELGITEPIGRLVADQRKAALVKQGHDIRNLPDLMGVCGLVFEPWAGIVPLADLSSLVAAVTGWHPTAGDLMEASERSNNLARAFNVREGIRRKDDCLPGRFSEPLPEGASQGASFSRAELETMLDGYYMERGWTREGIPGRRKLTGLGLSDVADSLEAGGVSCRDEGAPTARGGGEVRQA